MINYDQEKLEVDGLPEYVRDSEVSSREAFVSISTKSLAEREAQRIASSERQSQRDTGSFGHLYAEPETPKTDELEALWPGVHQDFLHSPKRTPSFYMMLGFLAGAVVSMAAIWGYTAVSTLVAQNAHPHTAVAAANAPQAAPQAGVNVPQGGDPGAVLKPNHNAVEVQSGDTLAAISLREYGKATPRLLDAICKANGLKNANFLHLGQKLDLPSYQPQSAQVAASSAAQVH